jgi:excisionase family DNA binding protein
MTNAKQWPLPWWEKYTLTVEEAAAYFGIGAKALRKLLKEHMDADFVIRNGAKVQIKRKLFESYVDTQLSAL